MAAAESRVVLQAAPPARERVRRARAVIDGILSEDRKVYGVSTGFGKFSNVVIDHEDLARLQRHLLRSHAAGVGSPLDEPAVRGMMVLKANELLGGHSGARESVVDALLAALNAGLYPVVPEQGSVGASGDLAPLAHAALALTGEGEAFLEGRRVRAREALDVLGLQPLELQAKDGLSLVNGTQLTTALLALDACGLERLVASADIVAGLTLDALLGSVRPTDPKVQRVRAHPGQVASASNLRRLLGGSGLVQSHADCDRVQDAYSLRCTPQVHGAARSALDHALRVLEVELNACTDNPLVFVEERDGESSAGGEAEGWDVISAGNFHAQIPALAADGLTLGLAQLAGISERRLERLVNPSLSEGLPAFLVPDGGVNSGFMMAQVTAAALVSECRTLTFPASSQSISTSADQEDFVSMGPLAARRARQALQCAEAVVAIELLAACQALDLREGGGPLRSSEPLEAVHVLLRERVPVLEEDRFLAPDIEIATGLVRSGAVLAAANEALGRPLA